MIAKKRQLYREKKAKEVEEREREREREREERYENGDTCMQVDCDKLAGLLILIENKTMRKKDGENENENPTMETEEISEGTNGEKKIEGRERPRERERRERETERKQTEWAEEKRETEKEGGKMF